MKETNACANCGFELDDDFQFCPKCGQERDHQNENFRSFINHFLKDYFTFDSKIFKSLSPLIIKPGFLTTEFRSGKRVNYIPPLRMYILISILFFLLLSVFGDDAPQKDDWDHFFDDYLPRLFFFLLPVFAGIMALLFIRRDRSFVTHFVYSLHFHSFVFLATSFYLCLSAITKWSGLLALNPVFLSLLLIAIGIYLVVSMKRVYIQNWAKSLFKTLLLLILYTGVLFLVISIAFLLLPGIGISS